MTTEKRRGRPRVCTDDDRRAEILAAAEVLFHEQGYGRTTMDAIAAALRMSKQTLYRQFPSKLQLFEALAERHRGAMLAFDRAGDALGVEAALAAIFRIDISEAEEARRRAFLRLGLERAHAADLTQAIYTQGLAPARAQLGEWLARRAASGEIRLDGDPVDYAAMLMAMVFASTTPPGFASDPFDPERHRAHIRRCIDVFLGGVAVRRNAG